MHRWFSHFIHFITALLLIVFAVIAVAISLSSKLQTDFVYYILRDSWVVFFIGIGACIVGSIAIATVFVRSKRYYQVSSVKCYPISIDRVVFQKYLNTYWEKLFPKDTVGTRLDLKENKVIISATLPYIPEVSRKPLIEQIHLELADILSRIIGYSGEFTLSIRFQKENVQKTPSKIKN